MVMSSNLLGGTQKRVLRGYVLPTLSQIAYFSQTTHSILPSGTPTTGPLSSQPIALRLVPPRGEPELTTGGGGWMGENARAFRRHGG